MILQVRWEKTLKTQLHRLNHHFLFAFFVKFLEKRIQVKRRENSSEDLASVSIQPDNKSLPRGFHL